MAYNVLDQEVEPGDTNAMRNDVFGLIREIVEGLDKLCSATCGLETHYHAPEIEIRRRNGVYRLIAQLPYVTDADESIRVFLQDGVLLLEGNSRTESRANDSGNGFLCTYRKRIALPEGVDPADVSARLFERSLVVEFPYCEFRQRQRPARAADPGGRVRSAAMG